MIKAVIFDIDGTLVDTVDLHARAWQQAFQHFGHDFPYEQIRAQIGKGGDQLLPVFLNHEELDTQSEEIEKYRSDLFKRSFLPQAGAFPKVRELFQHIRECGQKIVLATSSKKDDLESYKRLAHIGDLIDGATTADDAEKSKPHPDIFHAVMDQLLGVAPIEAIAVGDTPYDAVAASRAGLRTIGLLSGGCAEEHLRAAGCVAIYREPADLLRHYDSSPASPLAK